jgi:endonuclease V-like protein UPF0215 family
VRNRRDSKGFAHVVGIDDEPFARDHRGDVGIVGAVFAGQRIEGILHSKVRRDGANSALRIVAMVGDSRFRDHVQLIMLQGIAVAGFNVVDVDFVSDRLGIPVLVVARKQPSRTAVRRALIDRVPGGRKKWAIIERLGPMEPIAGVWIQRVRITKEDAARTIARFAIHGNIPEPLRVAHLVAGGMATGESRGRV